MQMPIERKKHVYSNIKQKLSGSSRTSCFWDFKMLYCKHSKTGAVGSFSNCKAVGQWTLK